jgi:hypothetical protein
MGNKLLLPYAFQFIPRSIQKLVAAILDEPQMNTSRLHNVTRFVAQNAVLTECRIKDKVKRSDAAVFRKFWSC